MPGLGLRFCHIPPQNQPPKNEERQIEQTIPQKTAIIHRQQKFSRQPDSKRAEFGVKTAYLATLGHRGGGLHFSSGRLSLVFAANNFCTLHTLGYKIVNYVHIAHVAKCSLLFYFVLIPVGSVH